MDAISVAPMLDCTDRHFRYLMRLISRRPLLYTEMYTVNEVLKNKTANILELNPIEHPIAVQFGGSDPQSLSQCTELALRAGYDEVNLNVGCPSGRVLAGGMGACLMLQPELVANCVVAMQNVGGVPVSVKCRLGVDHHDSYEQLSNFIHIVASAGCQKFIIHARKAWLSGLSPKQNRSIPPLNYDWVYQIKNDFPKLTIILNGGVTSVDEIAKHLFKTDGVMIGRAIYNNPFLLAGIDQYLYQENSIPSEREVALKYLDYVENELLKGARLHSMTRHLLGLFHNKPRACYWRKYLSCHSSKKGVGTEVIKAALAEVA